MNNAKTEILNREELALQMSRGAIKHLWLANKIGVSEKTLSRWVSGDVTRIRRSNLNKLADALGCDRATLIAFSEVDLYPTSKNRDVLVNELNNDSLLYELLAGSKIKLAVSLIKSACHSALPSGIISNFYIKLGYASLLHRESIKAKKYFVKGLDNAKSANNESLVFSANLGLATTFFFECKYKKCREYLSLCEGGLDFSEKEKAHFYNTFSLYYLYIGDIDSCIEMTNKCIEECSASTASMEKSLFFSSALQLQAACFLFNGDIERAGLLSVKSLSLAEQSGYKRSIAVSKVYLAAVYTAEKKHRQAMALMEEGLQLVSSQDISLPSLLSIAVYVCRAAGESERMDKLAEYLFSLACEDSAPNAFAIYQLYLADVSLGDLAAAKLKLSQVTSIIATLELDVWLDWLGMSSCQRPLDVKKRGNKENEIS